MRGHPVDPRNALRMEVGKPTSLGPETSPMFWNPGLFGIKLADERFRERLHSLDPDLEAAWNAYDEKWAIWFRKPSINYPLCRGWLLLFTVKDENGAYVPLDERTLAKCYLISGQHWGSGKKYFDSVVREFERDKETKEKASSDEEWYRAGEYFDYTRPKVGYGPISASKMVGQ